MQNFRYYPTPSYLPQQTIDMSIEDLVEKIHRHPDAIEFDEVIEAINSHYDYTPTAFRNGDINNSAGSNEGSCKIFAFALLHKLDEAQTLACFGKYYRQDVLNHPDGSDHANIRNFMQYGWRGIDFDGHTLADKG